MNISQWPIVGEWKCDSDYTSVVIRIHPNNDRKIEILAIDSDDGEKLDVQILDFSPSHARFITIVPSNNYRVENLLTVVEDDHQRCIMKLTYEEKWIRAR